MYPEHSLGEGRLKYHEKVLVYGHGYAERPEVDVDLRDLLQTDRLRPGACDLSGNRSGAHREVRLAERFDRGEQGGEVVTGIGRCQRMNHEVHVGAHVEILRHHDNLGRSVFPDGTLRGHWRTRIIRLRGVVAAGTAEDNHGNGERVQSHHHNRLRVGWV